MIVRFVAEGALDDLPPETPSALDDLQAAEKEASKTGDYDAVHQKTQALITEYQEENPDDGNGIEMSPDGDSGSSDDFLGDDDGDATGTDDGAGTDDADATNDDEAASTDDDSTSDGAEAKDGKSDDADATQDDEQKDRQGKRQSLATESMRSEYYNCLVTEAIEWDDVKRAGSAVASGIGVAAGFAGRMGMRAAQALKELGIAYGPTVLAGLKKGVVYLFTKAVTVLLGMLVSTVRYAKRVRVSFTRHKKTIAKLREDIKAMETRLASSGGGTLVWRTKECTNEKQISWFTAGGKSNVMGSAQVIGQFMNGMIVQLDRQIMTDLQVVKKLIELSESRLSGDPLALLRVNPFSGNFMKKRVKGYSADAAVTETYVYGVTLPDRLLFVMDLPRQDLKDYESIRHAYQESGIYLGVENSQVVQADKVDYMDIKETLQFLDVLEHLCDAALSHNALYAKINKAVEQLKFGYKHYYQKLVSNSRETTVRNSLVEYVYLKQSFVSRTYLPAAMDIHDYVAAYLVHALSFAKQSIGQWTVSDPVSAD